ncbi:MAG: PSD1 domain-containing protein [Bryobacterales bacterium]|nr:PSD1 domain-containing protein [Bryobacterales bacterium]
MRLPFLLAACAWAAPAQQDTEFFETKIRPVLAANCYACHTQSAMGGLRLDSREAAMAGGKSGAIIVPGDPAGSVLIQAVRRTHARLKMPPTAPLKASEVALLEDWVKRGAVWPASAPAPSSTAKALSVTAEHRKFWSFQPLSSAPPPSGGDRAWIKTGVDAFILAKLRENKLSPNAPSDRTSLLRRVTLDLTGLPPTPEEAEAFRNDPSPDAFAKVVDRLLASPHYGERWARHWLDLARYSDGLLAAGTDTPLPNAFRYRDWVVDAFNSDMPYNTFVKAQIAADLLPPSERAALLPGLGFQAIVTSANDQVDTTTKVFLGMTVGCAQCHDHKYDPIPTRDYYSLLGIFRSSASHQTPLVSDAEAAAFEAQKKKVDAHKELINDFIADQQKLLADTLARHTARYIAAAWNKMQGRQPDLAGLDNETLSRWVEYLKSRDKEHPYMKDLYAVLDGGPSEAQVQQAARAYQKFVLELFEESKEVDDKNYVAFGGKKGMKDERTRQYTNIVSLPVLKFYQWRELASGPYNIDGFRAPAGIYYYAAKEMGRWMGGFAKAHLDTLRAELKALEAQLPPQYPFLHTLKEGPKPADVRVAIRGDNKTPGEIAPRQFLSVLCDGEAKRFEQGSGRKELAEAIAAHPLTARVIVNRLWQHHFGAGIVRTASNFGQMGERPSHPELLDYLARKLVESNYSLKAIHREILLSNTYGLSSANQGAAAQVDPGNRLLWRANARPRLDMESLRDSVLAVSGNLDKARGGAAKPLSDDNKRRSLYLTVSRTRLDATMSLFDFPDPNATTEERPTTIGPLQGLFFLNSSFIAAQAKTLAARLDRESPAGPENRIRRAYALLFTREPDAAELRLGIEYTAKGNSAWPRYLQVLLGSGEFTSVP